MKKNLLYIALAIGLTTLFSCQEELEIWDSATLDYSGRFVYQVLDETGQTLYVDYDSEHILSIYNTSSNEANNVWIDEGSAFPFKCKQTLTGDPTAFASESLNFDDLENSVPAVALPTSKPTAAGQETTVARYAVRVGVEDAKILKGAATTIGGNAADSLYMEVIIYSGNVTFTSYEKPQSLWADPLVPEYGWELTSVAYDNTLDESYIIAGHRYTGFPEDHY